uniref:Mediator of RNA polymerase II transcription subunit 14 n=1 Tax=Megaselia scalaris TaxID=36166 RepID=T1GS83_MEGSC
DRLDENIKIDEYIPGVKLTVSYWRELTTKDPKSELGYKLTIQTDPNDPTRTLSVIHIPSIGQKESNEIADRAIHSDHLSMERLIVHTVYIRSVQRLTDLKAEFNKFLKNIEYFIQGTPAILTIPILNPCLRAEQIHVTVDTHTGMLKCHVPKHLDCPIMPEFQLALNGDTSKLAQLSTELRYWITHKRCEITLQHLPAVIMENLPFLSPPTLPLLKSGRQKIFVKLKRHPQIVLILHLKEKENNPNEIDYTFHLGFLNFVSQEDPAEGQQQVPHPPEIPRFYTKLLKLVEFDTFVATHGPGTHVNDVPSYKRKLGDFIGQPASKQAKTIIRRTSSQNWLMSLQCVMRRFRSLLCLENSPREIYHTVAFK